MAATLHLGVGASWFHIASQTTIFFYIWTIAWGAYTTSDNAPGTKYSVHGYLHLGLPGNLIMVASIYDHFYGGSFLCHINLFEVFKYHHCKLKK